MTVLQIVNVIRTYSIDVLILALGVTLVTSLCKKTVMKNCPKKVFVFLPFLFGIVFYAVYRALSTWSAAAFTSEIKETLEKGLSCGLAATLYYCVYEQFFRTDSNSLPPDPLYTLLEGVVPEDRRPEAMEKLTAAYRAAAESERFQTLLETLSPYAEQLSEAELEAAVLILMEYFKAMLR